MISRDLHYSTNGIWPQYERFINERKQTVNWEGSARLPCRFALKKGRMSSLPPFGMNDLDFPSDFDPAGVISV